MTSLFGFNPFKLRWWFVALLSLSLACERSQPPAPPPPRPAPAPVNRKSSSYNATLVALQKTHGLFEIVEEPEELETEALLDKVADGEIPFTVADSDLLAAEQAYRDGLEIAFPLPIERTPASKESSRAIAFAVRKDAVKLRGFLDGFVKKT